MVTTPVAGNAIIHTTLFVRQSGSVSIPAQWEKHKYLNGMEMIDAVGIEGLLFPLIDVQALRLVRIVSCVRKSICDRCQSGFKYEPCSYNKYLFAEAFVLWRREQ